MPTGAVLRILSRSYLSHGHLNALFAGERSVGADRGHRVTPLPDWPYFG